jgi:hypothetical membrane protein
MSTAHWQARRLSIPVAWPVHSSLATRRSAIISAGLAPILLTGAYLMAGILQPASYSPVRDTISVMAGQAGTDRWVMTGGIVLTGGCYLVTAVGLTGVRASARALLIVAGLAGIGIAASPEPTRGTTPRHLAWTVLGAVTIAVWPAFAARRASPRPLILSVYGSAAVTAVFVALLGWLLAETRDGSVLGLAERLTTSIQTCWPFIIAVALRRTQHPRSRPGHRRERRDEGRRHRAGRGRRPQAGPVIAARLEAPRAGVRPVTVTAPARRAGLARPRLPAVAELATIGAGYLGYALVRLAPEDRALAQRPRPGPHTRRGGLLVRGRIAAGHQVPGGVGGQPDPSGSVGAGVLPMHMNKASARSPTSWLLSPERAATARRRSSASRPTTCVRTRTSAFGIAAGLARPAGRRQQPQFPGAPHGRGPVTDTELGVDAADMRADGVRRDGQLAGDLGPGQVGRQVPQHPQLARAELLRRRR